MPGTLELASSDAATWYLLLYGVTLLVHVVFMNYVLAGCGYMAVVGLCHGHGDGFRSPIMRILRDWMPFVLSAAITAGVAPLLFVQVLYKKEFYTANLLLGPRIMLLLPALIIAFYLLYVMKSRRMSLHTRWVRAAIPGFVFACFLYTAWTWTENHLLSIHEEAWVDQYVGGTWSLRSDLVLPRFLTWCFGSLPTLCAMLLWQLHWRASGIEDAGTTKYRLLGGLAIGALLFSIVCAAWTYRTLPGRARDAIASPHVLLFLWVVTGGCLLQIAGWVWLLVNQRETLRVGLLVSLGLLTTIAGTIVLRESIRLSQLHNSVLDVVRSVAGAAEGPWIFLFFLVLNAILIGWCVRVAHGARSTVSA